jgi:hypothetical protein
LLGEIMRFLSLLDSYRQESTFEIQLKNKQKIKLKGKIDFRLNWVFVETEKTVVSINKDEILIINEKKNI